VPDTRLAYALLSARFYGFPSELLKLAGVTGTNGKTTVSWMLRSIIEASGKSCGLIGTINYNAGSRCIPAKNTTPSPQKINEMLAEMVQAGQEYAVMEVSSHALMQKRVHAVNFDVGIFTNITDNEHLDYHKTFAAYRDAKCKLFEALPSSGYAVLNLEDPSSGYIAQRTQARKITYAVARDADIRTLINDMSMSGTSFEIFTPHGSVPVNASFFGRYNVSNATAAAAAALCMGIGIDAIKQGLESYEGTPGRLESINCGQDFSVLVDYAHTADALENVLVTLKRIAPRRIILVFGCGGNRDAGKRPKMGAVAKKYADFFVVTADNSRLEPTAQIIAAIEDGIGECSHHVVEPDRTEAIKRAINEADAGDVVLIAGKGHETYQILGSTTRPYDDREEARAAIRALAQQPNRKTVA